MRTHSSLAAAALAFASFALAAPGARAANAPAETNRVDLVARLVPERAAPGDLVTLRLEATVREPYHIYAPDTAAGYPTSLKLDAGTALAPEGSLLFPPPHEAFDPVFEETVRTFGAGPVVFEQRLRVPADANPGASLAVTGTLVEQACDEATCVIERLPFDLALAVVEPGSGGAAGGSTGATGGAAARETPVPEQGLAAFLLLAVGAALLSLGTPCVFPMIPITVSVFSKDAGGSRGRALFLASVYAIGIIVTFTTFGVLTAVIGGESAANAIAANGWINLALALLFVAFGLSLLGAFDISVPDFLLRGATEAQQRRTGVGAVLLMGLVFTLTSFTCTVPIVGALLVQAVSGDLTRPIVGMVAFSATFAFPFFFLALFPSALGRLPRAGSWMNAIKVTLGLFELAMAFKFFSNADMVWDLRLLTRPAFLAVWVALFGVTALYLLGRIRVGYDEAAPSLGPGRLCAGVLFLAFTLYLASGYGGTRFPNLLEGWLPPRAYGQEAAGTVAERDDAGAAEHLSFLQSYREARDAALAANRPLFVDFTGVTCVNCRAMEGNVFPKPAIRAQLERFVRVQLWVDKGAEQEWNAQFQVKLAGTSAQPYYVILDPRDESVLARYEGYTFTTAMEEEFRATLQRAADAWDAAAREGEATPGG